MPPFLDGIKFLRGENKKSMEKFKNFKLASLVFAYYINGVTEEKLQKDLDFYLEHVPLNKAYIENHRGLVDIPDEQLQMVKRVFERNGIETSGCITTTQLVGERKPSIFDTPCFTDPAHRKKLVDCVETAARNFDEIIFDDYFFSACRCEKCIAAKGKMSWKEYKLKVANDVSKEVVAAAKKINPKVNFIIKFPNWYESFQECGYNPKDESEIFDMIYTGTESRNSNYNGQHLQRYLSYSLVRWLENVAPGRNGGGWIDLGGSQGNISVLLEQAELTYFARAKELMLFNFQSYINHPALAALGVDLKRVDDIMGKVGNPVGISTYEPHDSDGEDQLINYIGQLGIPLEPKPYFDDQAKTIFLTQNSAEDPDVVEKLKAYVEKGGTAIVTSGFMRKTIDKGFSDLTSVRPTNRKVSGTRYQCCNLYHGTYDVAISDEPATFTKMEHKNNATWYDVLLHINDNSTAIVTDDDYGKGIVNILNIPDNFGDLYRLPKEVQAQIARDFARNEPVYLAARPQYNFFRYDNDTFGVFSHAEFKTPAEIVIRGDEYIGFENIETGQRFTEPAHTAPAPRRHGDSASTRVEPEEKYFNLPMWGGGYAFFRLLKKGE